MAFWRVHGEGGRLPNSVWRFNENKLVALWNVAWGATEMKSRQMERNLALSCASLKGLLLLRYEMMVDVN